MTTPPRSDDPEPSEDPDDGPTEHPHDPGGPECGYQLPPAYLPPGGYSQPGPPPPADYPHDGPPLPPDYPYYGPSSPADYPHYGPPPTPGYPHPQWRPPPPASRISIGMVFAGCAVWVIVNVVVALAAILASSGGAFGSDNVILGGAAAGLALIAFGVGGGLLAARNRHAKGLGLGLMIGWALTSLLTAGFCTGINPGMYTL